MVSALISGSSGPGLRPGWGHCVLFLDKTLYSHCVSLHPGIEMGTGEFNAGGLPSDRLASHPRGSRNTLKSLHAKETGISSGLMGHLACIQTLPFYLLPHPEWFRQLLQHCTANRMLSKLIDGCYCLMHVVILINTFLINRQTQHQALQVQRNLLVRTSVTH